MNSSTQNDSTVKVTKETDNLKRPIIEEEEEPKKEPKKRKEESQNSKGDYFNILLKHGTA